MKELFFKIYNNHYIMIPFCSIIMIRYIIKFVKNRREKKSCNEDDLDCIWITLVCAFNIISRII